MPRPKGRPKKAIKEVKEEVKEEVFDEESIEVEPIVVEPSATPKFPCSLCGGTGLARPEYAGSELCARCAGTGLEPA